MGSAVGLTTALVTGVESVYGTPVVTDRGLEFDGESLERKNEVISSNALRAGVVNLRRGCTRRVVAARWGEGEITFEAVTNGLGRLFQHVLGSSNNVQQGATPAYLQTHSLSSASGKSLTIQKQLRDEANTVVSPFTFHGCKFPKASFSISKKGKLMISLGVDAEDVETATAAVIPVYPTAKAFHFAQGTLKIDGVALARVSDSTITFDRALDTERFHLGSAGLKAEPLTNDFPTVTGSLSAEVTDLSLYNRFVADTAAALILEFTGDVISGAFSELLRITVPEIRFTGETPKVSGPNLVVSPMPFEGQANPAGDPGMKIEYMTTDTTY